MKPNAVFALCAALLLVSACDTPSPTTTTTRPAEPETFTVDVQLSPGATTKLAAIKETIIVGADYYGNPAPNAPAQPEPGIELGRQTVELHQAGRAVFALANADPAKLAMVDQRDIRILVNVYSGRRNAEDNLLDCGIFEDSARVAVRGPIPIKCTLIGE